MNYVQDKYNVVALQSETLKFRNVATAVLILGDKAVPNFMITL